MSNFFERLSSWQKAWPSESSNKLCDLFVITTRGRLRSSLSFISYAKLRSLLHFRWDLQANGSRMLHGLRLASRWTLRKLRFKFHYSHPRRLDVPHGRSRIERAKHGRWWDPNITSPATSTEAIQVMPPRLTYRLHGYKELLPMTQLFIIISKNWTQTRQCSPL